MSDGYVARKRGRTTLSDIARVLSLSEATVSRGLQGKPEISKQTRVLIHQVAQDLGYVPNAAARSLARQASRTLGLIVPDVTDPVHGLIVAGFGRAADRRGYTVIVLDGSRDDARRKRALRTLTEHQAEGIALCGGSTSPSDLVAEIRPAHAVLIMPDNTAADPIEGSPIGIVRADDEDGIRMLVQHLVDTGRKRISYVNGPDIASNRNRRGAILNTLEELGIEPRIREYSTTLEPAQLESIAFLVSRERPDALICYDDKMALYLLDSLRSAGVAVPDDVAVAGFDGISFAAISHPRLTTVVQPAEQLGDTAAQLLFEAIETGLQSPNVTLPVTLEIRGSSAGVIPEHRPSR